MPQITYQDTHLAGNWSEDWSSKPVILGDTPAIVTTQGVAGETMAALTVVGKDGSGNLVPAVLGGATPIEPVGILPNAVDLTVQGSTGTTAYWVAGKFNYDALVWDASYTTDAEKKAAFEGTGVQIFLDKPRYD